MRDTINAEILEVASSYLGQEEILGNRGFKNKEFEKDMKNVGWQVSNAWCSFFVEFVWKKAYQQWDATLFTRLDKLFSGSAVTTLRNFKKTKDFVVSKKPTIGSLVVYQRYKKGKPHWSGHIAVVKSFNIKKGVFTSIDGNTNDKGGREGYIVAEISRKLNFEKKEGLVLKGFIHPKVIE